MEIEDWKKRELEKIYVNVFILEEVAYVRIKEKIKKQKIYIMIGLNLKGYKEIIGVYVPENESTSYWLQIFSEIKERGVNNIFMISMINNKWLKKVFKMHYPKGIMAPSLIELYNNTYNYIARKDHRIIMREMSRIYKAETIEDGEKIYYNLIENYKSNKLLIMIINKYIKEIFDMYQYSHQARIITSNTDSYNKMRCRIRWNLKKNSLYETPNELKKHLYKVLKEEEQKWHPSRKNWDKIINEMDCDLADIIYELI